MILFSVILCKNIYFMPAFKLPFFVSNPVHLDTQSFLCCLYKSCNNRFCNKLSCHFISCYKVFWEALYKDAVWKWIEFYYFSLKQVMLQDDSPSRSLLFIAVIFFLNRCYICVGFFNVICQSSRQQTLDVAVFKNILFSKALLLQNLKTRLMELQNPVVAPKIPQWVSES